MSSFFRKAVSLFVILDEPVGQKPSDQSAPVPKPVDTATSGPAVAASATMSNAELAKFEQHFDQLFEQTNLPGPDYFEFWKTMDTLEAHIPDESARIKAVYASLKIQGLTKQTLVFTAGKYREVILQDKANFEAAVQKKSQAEIAGRESEIAKIEQAREEKRRMIEQLQQEIEASAKQLETLQAEIATEQNKIEGAQRGYLAACMAMVGKIESDIERFQQIID
ncbi:MAG: hypothetical protein IPM98_10515 [Lewinellaceae bacterium]|nr:hypothetical protein [Lewinellaceae bacterium]